MSVKRLVAIGFIFVVATAAWFALGASVVVRTRSADTVLGAAVAGLWGTEQIQQAPTFRAADASGPVGIDVVSSDVASRFRLDQRRKGLLWYATYVVDFSGAYSVANPTTSTVRGTMGFAFPDASGLYDAFRVRVGGREVPVTYRDGSATAEFPLPPRSTVPVAVTYRTNGLNRWTYVPSPKGVTVLRDFTMAMRTDFSKVDYPDDGVSPTRRERQEDGWTLVWHYDRVVSGRPIGIIMPRPLNPGPIVSRITFFAPVSLLFFFAALVILTATGGAKLHPMHYLFLAAAFFAFDLLLGYLADQIDINAAFAIAALASVLLVVGYLRVVIGWNRVLVEIAVSQFVFLVLFSYSFFLKGLTGLAITIGSVLTLAFFMWKTAGVDWNAVFKKPSRPEAAYPEYQPVPATASPITGNTSE
jgi:Inner membrane protein CreD